MATKPHPALALLSQAHPPEIAAQIHQDQVRYRPLLLRPSSPDPKSADNQRAKRRQVRQRHALQQHRDNKTRKKAGRKSLSLRPKPLSAKEKRKLGVHDITDEEKKWEIYVGLHELWCDYMREVLGLGPASGGDGDVQTKLEQSRRRKLSAETAGPLLASADFHGALMTVVRSGCVSRVGLEGIVVRDTRYTFVLITRRNELKTVPKEGTVFSFAVSVMGTCLSEDSRAGEEEASGRPLEFELHGEQFQTSAPDRANKKFRQHISPFI